VDGGTLRVEEGVIIERNKNVYAPSYPPGFGGGVAVTGGGTFFMSAGTIRDNDVREYGGAVAVTGGGTFQFSGGELRDNAAGSGGGALYVANGAAILSGGLVSSNRANLGGGVGIGRRERLSSPQAMVRLSGTVIIEENHAAGAGGGVYIQDVGPDYPAKLDMYGGIIRNNTSLDSYLPHGGGGVCLAGYGVFNMSGGEIGGNTANSGGGVYVYNTTAAFNLTGGTIRENSAFQNGDGVYVNSGSFTMSGSAAVDTGNAVFLCGTGASNAPGDAWVSGSSITLAGPLTAYPAARIILQYQLTGWPVLRGDVAAGFPPNYMRFTVESGGIINTAGIWNP
jgi:hypothetical protein